MASWTHFAHDADIGVRGIGLTKAEAFRQAALALTAVVTDPVAVRRVDAVPVRCEAPNDELLFVEWLNALIYEMAVRAMLFGRRACTMAPQRVQVCEVLSGCCLFSS